MTKKFDESKHPRDEDGKFTDGNGTKSLSAEEAKKKNFNFKDSQNQVPYEKWNKGFGAGGDASKSRINQSEQIGEVDFSNKEAVINKLNEFEQQATTLTREVSCVITSDGKIWATIGEENSVDPSQISSELNGAYAYHNHPPKTAHYSFSGNDIAFFLESKMQYSKASDHLYEYIMERTPDTLDMEYGIVYNDFKETERLDVGQMAWEGRLDTNIDGYHKTMEILSKNISSIMKGNLKMRMIANKEHPDYPEYIEKCKASRDRNFNEIDRLEAEYRKNHPNTKIIPEDLDIPILKKYDQELEKLKKEYAYLFTIPYDENSN